MINIIFGEDVTSSRNFFYNKKSEFTNSYSFDGKSINSNEIYQLLNNSSLFSEGPIFIENFFSNLKSVESQNLLSYLIENENSTDIFIWEEKAPTKTVLKDFKKPTLVPFELPKTVFSFLDSIRPNSNKTNIASFRNALAGNDPEILFYMIIRQFRLLIAISDYSSENIDEVKRLAPWQKDKLTRQSKLFGNEKLVKEYNKLYEIDYSIKTGNTSRSLTQAIDFFLADL